MKYIAIIPARGGSKGIPRKNIVLVDNHPLIYYSIREAMKVPQIDRVFVSTDDQQIAKVALDCGAEVIIRPSEFSSDTATSASVLVHAIEYLKKTEQYTFDAVILLQPTTPQRKAEHISESIALFEKNSPDSLVSVESALDKQNPYWVRTIVEQNGKDNLIPFMRLYDPKAPSTMRRQDLPCIYARNGQIYISKCSVLLQTGDLYGDWTLPYIMSRSKFPINLDTPDDLAYLEYLISTNRLKLNE